MTHHKPIFKYHLLFAQILPETPLTVWEKIGRGELSGQFEYITVFAVTLVSLLSFDRLLGVLYLVTPIWTYALLNTSLASWTGLFNSILPAVIGMFTAWFEKWYPKHYAAGGGR